MERKATDLAGTFTPEADHAIASGLGWLAVHRIADDSCGRGPTAATSPSPAWRPSPVGSCSSPGRGPYGLQIAKALAYGMEMTSSSDRVTTLDTTSYVRPELLSRFPEFTSSGSVPGLKVVPPPVSNGPKTFPSPTCVKPGRLWSQPTQSGKATTPTILQAVLSSIKHFRRSFGMMYLLSTRIPLVMCASQSKASMLPLRSKSQ